MNDLIIRRPESSSSTPVQLFLLFHGVGSSAEDLRPLGQVLAAQYPQAWVVNVRSPDRSDLGQGWQWFSVRGVTEENRPSRIAETMPRFVAAVAEWQQISGASPESTTLVGFSQGSITALESTQLDSTLAGRVVAIAGRFATPPRIAPRHTLIHLLHGELDGVVPASQAVEAASQLKALSAAVTLDLFPGLGHGIDSSLVQRLIERLSTSTSTGPA